MPDSGVLKSLQECQDNKILKEGTPKMFLVTLFVVGTDVPGGCVPV